MLRICCWSRQLRLGEAPQCEAATPINTEQLSERRENTESVQDQLHSVITDTESDHGEIVKTYFHNKETV